MRHFVNNFQPCTGNVARDVFATLFGNKWVSPAMNDQSRYADLFKPLDTAAVGDNGKQLTLHSDGIIATIKRARCHIDKGAGRSRRIGK